MDNLTFASTEADARAVVAVEEHHAAMAGTLAVHATALADLAGASPRIVQRLMRHSSLDMTNRYTRPRMHDLEGATSALPSLRPEASTPDSARATGTDGQPISERLAHYLPKRRR